MSLRGGCLCGAVRFEIEGKVSDIWQCHCPKCRKSSGSAHGAMLRTSGHSFRWIAGAEHVRSYATDNDYLVSFCERCGSPMPRARGRYMSIPAGSLDDDPCVQPAFHAFVSRKAPWHEITDALPRYPDRPPAADGGKR